MSRHYHQLATPWGGARVALQVREALRRSRVESRDLRTSLFRAEDVIKQLTLTKAARRRGAYLSNTAQHEASSSPASPSSVAAAATAAAGEKERRLVSYLLTPGGGRGGGGGGGGGERGREGGGGQRDYTGEDGNRSFGHFAEPDGSRVESLLARVQQLEGELRLADVQNARDMGAAVKEQHSYAQRKSVEEVRSPQLAGHVSILSCAKTSSNTYPATLAGAVATIDLVNT